MRPILQIEFVAVLNQRERLGPPPSLERVDDGPLMGDFHDGPTQDRVVVPAEFAKNASGFSQVVEAFLQPLDQLQRVVFALPRLEAAVAHGAPRGLIHGRSHPRSASPYSTLSRTSPWGGAVGPDRVRSRPARSSDIHEGVRAPRPTSTRLPTMLRTMWWRKLSADSSTATRSPRARSLAERTVQVGVRPRPGEAQNAEKSCLPRSDASASRIAPTSRAKRGCQATRRRSGWATGPRSMR